MLGPRHDRNRRRPRQGDPRQSRQSHPGVRGDRRLRHHRARGRALRGEHWRARGPRAARRRKGALRRQGRAHRGGKRAQPHRAPAHGHGCRGPGGARPADDRVGWNASEEVAGRQRHSRRLSRRRPRRRHELRHSPLSLSRRGERAHAPGSVDEHPQRRGARRFQRGHPGVHGRPLGSADVHRGAAHGGGGLPCSQRRAQGARLFHRGRRRRRIRAQPEVEPGGAGGDRRGHRQGRLQARHRHGACARLRGERVLQGRQVRPGR